MTSTPFRRSRALSTTSTRVHEGFARRHQRGAVLQGPGVILDVRDFEAAGAQLHGEVDVLLDVVDVLAVHRRVERQRQAEFLHPAGDFALLGAAALVGGDAVGVLGVDVLDRELHVVEAVVAQLDEAVAGQRHAGGDEVGVEADLGRGLDDVFEVLARRRLAAREVDLQHAEGGGLAHDVLPFGGGQLGVDALQLGRVRAVRALQRAAMRQLAQHADRRAGAGRRRIAAPLSGVGQASIGARSIESVIASIPPRQAAVDQLRLCRRALAACR